MGTSAENSAYAAHDGKVVRFGLDKPPFTMRWLPPEIKGAPDFLGSKHFYEACGVGHDQIVKIKHYKHDAQMYWDQLHPVIYHIYDSSNRRWAEIEARVVQQLIDEGLVPTDSFAEDNKEYYALPMSLIMEHACDAGAAT